MTSPTARSMALLRKRGLVPAQVERWNAWAKVRHDAFGIFDVIAIGDGYILGVQSTTLDHLGERKTKLFASPHTRLWLEAGGKIELHGWRKLLRPRPRWEAKIIVLHSVPVSD